jgi:hypothetical protein
MAVFLHKIARRSSFPVADWGTFDQPSPSVMKRGLGLRNRLTPSPSADKLNAAAMP